MQALRVLLDECIDRRFAKQIPDHAIRTVPEMGWTGLKNGELLNRAQAEFDVFVTVDRNLSYQQDLSRFSIFVLVLRAPSNRLADLVSLLPSLCSALDAPEPGVAVVISS